MGRIKYLLVNKLDNEHLLDLINRGISENSRNLIHSVCDVLMTRRDVDILIKSMAANHTRITIDRLYKSFNTEMWTYYIQYHIYYIMADHVRAMPEKAQALYKDSHVHTFYAIIGNESEKNIEAARYVDYLLSVSSRG